MAGTDWHRTQRSGWGVRNAPVEHFSQAALAAPPQVVIGAVLCGNDGRRGYINHLAVAQAYRGRGLGRALVDECRAVMRKEGIAKCNLVTFRSNIEGNAFWDAIGSVRRDDALYRSIETGEML